jgi:hypothetical protein
MKKLLLFGISVALFGNVMAQCPADFKSNTGGGNCPDTYQGLQKTGVITFTFKTAPSCLPVIAGVVDQDGAAFGGVISAGAITNQNQNSTTVQYCAYGTAPKDNYFNQPNLILSLDYSGCPPGSTFTGVYFCGPGSEIPLPVKFSSFTATRSNSSSVSIAWTTAQEQNSKGFYVQKNVAGVWTNVAFVFSQAQDGNSTAALNYSYTDANTQTGITQYRIQQVDLDGRVGYSDIKAIRGEGNLAKIVVYPNPSTDGKLNIVFEDNSSLRDVFVNDMQGKAIRSFRGISNNILVIEKLTTGFYTIKVTNRTTNASSVHKVVIK